MKRIFIFALILIALTIYMPHSAAKTLASQNDEMTLDEILAAEQEKNKKYLTKIEGQMSEFISSQNTESSTGISVSKDNGDMLASYDLSGLYQVHVMDNLFISAVKELGSFADAITGNVQWKIPVQTDGGNVGLATLYEKDGNLEYIGNTVGDSARIWMVTEESIRDAIENAGKSGHTFLSMQFAHSYLYSTTFVYLTAPENEYLIPFSYYADRIHLENGKLYTVSEIINIFDSYFDEQQLIDRPDSNGGVPFRQQPLLLSGLEETPKTIISVKTAVLIILASFTGIFFLVRYMKKHD